MGVGVGRETPRYFVLRLVFVLTKKLHLTRVFCTSKECSRFRNRVVPAEGFRSREMLVVVSDLAFKKLASAAVSALDCPQTFVIVFKP